MADVLGAEYEARVKSDNYNIGFEHGRCKGRSQGFNEGVEYCNPKQAGEALD